MATRSTRTMRLSVGLGCLVLGGFIAYAAVPTILAPIGNSDYIGLAGGPATLIARHLVTPAGETTGAWHYHPGYVYNVVKSGTIVVEDGCGAVNAYSAGQGFETSEGRVHRAYNLGEVDAVEYNMFVNIGNNNATLTKFIPSNERRCGPPSVVDECKGGGWVAFNHPTSFANQGHCMAYVNGRPTITLLVPEDPL